MQYTNIKTRLFLLVLAVMLTLVSSARGKKTISLPVPEVEQVSLLTAEDSVSYAIGMCLGDRMFVSNNNFDGASMEILAAAFTDVELTDEITSKYKHTFGGVNEQLFRAGLNNALLGDTIILTTKASAKHLRVYSRKYRTQKNQENYEIGEKFLAENKTKEGVVTLPNGLQYKVIVEGHGAKPARTDKVMVNYTGKLLNGTVFNSSTKHGGPVESGLVDVIPAWTEALQLMPVGSKWEVYVPTYLGFGAQGSGDVIEPNEILIFEIELLSIVKE